MAWHYSWHLFVVSPPVSSWRFFPYIRMYVLAFRGRVGASGCFACPPPMRATRNCSSYIWVRLCIRTHVSRYLFLEVQNGSVTGHRNLRTQHKRNLQFFLLSSHFQSSFCFYIRPTFLSPLQCIALIMYFSSSVFSSLFIAL